MWEKYDREELYQKVWEQPLLKVAEEYGVSAVALSKTCRKLSVPVPGRGHWAKLAYGKEGVNRPPLPKLDKVPVVFRSPVVQKKPTISQDNDPEFAQINQLFSSGALNPPAIDRTTGIHPLIRHTASLLRSRSRKDENGILLPREAGGLDLKVSEGTIDRALQVMHQILAALERQGYRAKYPSNYLRLLFIANRIVPQHKEFLDEHGYEFREIPESDFARRLAECNARAKQSDLGVEVATTPGVLGPSMHDILYDIEKERMTLSYKMLLLVFLAERTDAAGKAPLRDMAEHFHSFFVERSVRGKAEENPNVVQPGVLSGRSLSGWEKTIADQPLHYISPELVVKVGEEISWAPRVWAVWSDRLRDEMRRAAFDRLVRYYDRNVPGGF